MGFSNNDGKWDTYHKWIGNEAELGHRIDQAKNCWKTRVTDEDANAVQDKCLIAQRLWGVESWFLQVICTWLKYYFEDGKIFYEITYFTTSGEKNSTIKFYLVPCIYEMGIVQDVSKFLWHG